MSQQGTSFEPLMSGLLKRQFPLARDVPLAPSHLTHWQKNKKHLLHLGCDTVTRVGFFG